MKAVILAGGLGTRLGEETDLMPKPMVRVGEQPILWHIMKTYSHYGINEFIICLGYKAAVIKEYFATYALQTSDITFDLKSGEMIYHSRQAEPWKVTLVDTGAESQTGGRLRRVRDYIGKETFCFTYGDGVSDVNIAELIKFHQHHGKLATVTAVSPPGRFGVLMIREQAVHGFAEKLESQLGGGLINGGYFVLEPKAIDYIESDQTVWEQTPMQKLTAQGQLMAWHHRGFWQCMDNPREKRDLEKFWQSGKAPWKVWA